MMLDYKFPTAMSQQRSKTMLPLNTQMKNLLVLTILLSVISYRYQENKVLELVKKANSFLESDLKENINIDSYLILLNKASTIDENNFNASYTKSKFLTFKKDSE
jgi:hypothetical protein